MKKDVLSIDIFCTNFIIIKGLFFQIILNFSKNSINSQNICK